MLLTIFVFPVGKVVIVKIDALTDSLMSLRHGLGEKSAESQLNRFH